MYKSARIDKVESQYTYKLKNNATNWAVVDADVEEDARSLCNEI
jgi:hypothetical protein